MKTRIISGTVFVALVTGFFLLREFVDFRLFNILIWFFAFGGTFEIARAVGGSTHTASKYVAVVFGGISVPLFCVVEHFMPSFGYVAVLGLAIVVFLFLLLWPNGGLELGLKVLPAVYPVLPLLTMLVANYLPEGKGFVAMLLTFVIAPFADTFAYFMGSLIGGKKLCPKLSPKKTWAGAFGSVIGGVIGALAVYFVFGKNLSLAYANIGIAIFACLGVVASILTIFGDLFASLIKRKVGIKDYGSIMPGHGGVMDRIDGMCIASALIMVVFLVL
jgi:phosphatidate cytidylyltransferase